MIVSLGLIMRSLLAHYLNMNEYALRGKLIIVILIIFGLSLLANANEKDEIRNTIEYGYCIDMTGDIVACDYK